MIRTLGRTGLLSLLALVSSLAAPATATAQDENDPALKQFYVANGAYNRKLYVVAIGQFSEFIRRYRNHEKIDQARYGLGLSYLALKQYREAVPHFDGLHKQRKLHESIDRGRLVILHGQCLLFDSRKDEAKNMLVASLKTLAGGPFESNAIATILSVVYGKRDWAEVIEWSTRAVAVSKATPDQKARAYFQKGYAEYRKGDAKAATVSLSAILGLSCLDAWKIRGQYLLGECHGALKDYEKSEVAYAAALPGMSGADGDEARYRLGLTRFILEKYPEALEQFEAYLGTASKSARDGRKLRRNRKPKRNKRGKSFAPEALRAPEAHLYAGRCLLEIEQHDKARVHFLATMEEDDDLGAQAHLWHARVYSRRGRYDEAAAHLAKAVTRYQGSRHASDLDFDYANALMSGDRTDWKQATQYFDRIERRGIDKFAQMPSVLSQTAVCFHQAGAYQNSFNANQRFLAKFASDPLAGDVRFMKAENLFMMSKLDEANRAYGEFVAKHGEHKNAPAGVFRMAQIHHDEGRWQASLDVAKPLLGKKPTGLLFQQLAFMVGDDHFRLNHWEQAVGPLEDFVAAFFDPVSKRWRKKRTAVKVPNVDTALIQLAVAYEKLGEKGKALGHLDSLNSKYPYHPSPQFPLALVEQGRLAYETGDFKLAQNALGRYLAENGRRGNRVFEAKRTSQLPRVYYYLGWVADSQRRYPEAAKHFAAAVKANSRHELAADASLQQGIAFVNASKFKESAKHFAWMFGAYPKHEKRVMLLYYAGLSQARLKSWRRADGHFRQVVERYPDDVYADEALYEWAWCARELKDKRGAIQRYERHLAKYPNSPRNLRVQSELSELNLDSKLHDQVIERLGKAVAEAKDPTLLEDIRYQLANAHFKKGDHEIAAAQFETLLSDYPKSKLLASIYFQAGEARFKLKETQRAKELFGKGVKIRGVKKELLEPMTMRLAEMQLQTGDFKSATKTYSGFLHMFRESQWRRNAQFGVAYAMERGGNSKRAADQYRKLIGDKDEVDLWMVRARYQLGECYFNLRQYEKALEYFVYVEVNYRRYPSWQAKSVMEMGRVLIAQGKDAQGRERLKTVITRFPKEQAAVVAGQLLDKLRRGQR